MKFSIDQYSLLKTLNIVSKAVSQNSTISVLKGFLIEVKEDGTLTITSSDMDFCVERKINCSVYKPGKIVVVAKIFIDIIRKLPDEDINFTLEDDILIIKTNYSEFKIITMEVEEFPNIGEIEGELNKITLNRDNLKNLIKRTEFAASTDLSKGVLVGVLFEIENNKINIVALDGYRMAIGRKSIENDKLKSFIISGKIIKEILKIITEIEESENVNLIIGNKKAVFYIDNTKIVTRLMEGDFIKYKDILPKTSSTKIVINCKELSDSIERADLLAKEGKNNLIKINIVNDLMSIRSSSEEGAVKEEIIVEKEGEDLEIGFNSKYIIDILKKLDDDKIIMEFNSPISPCLVKSIENDEYEFLVLPVRISV